MIEPRAMNNGWFAGWREQRRIQREEAREREHRVQGQIDRLLREYPVDRSRDAKYRTNSYGMSSGGFWGGGDGGFWSGFGGDGGGDGGGC